MHHHGLMCFKKSKKDLPGLRAKIFPGFDRQCGKISKIVTINCPGMWGHPRMWQCTPECGDACHVPEHGIVGLLQFFLNYFSISQHGGTGIFVMSGDVAMNAGMWW